MQSLMENQSASVSRHLLIENALIALQCCHWINNLHGNIVDVMVMKLNMIKAYDKVEWPFLRQGLLTLGFLHV